MHATPLFSVLGKRIGDMAPDRMLWEGKKPRECDEKGFGGWALWGTEPTIKLNAPYYIWELMF